MISVPSRLLLTAFAFAFSVQAQNQGLTAEWDIRAVLKEIAAHSTRLSTMLDQADPNAWVAKGAPDTYVAQWKSTRAQAQALAGEAGELGRDPEKLAPALQAFFRMQYLEFTLGSLQNGIRRYQSPALADELAGLAAENGANRERFQRYIVELAAQREQEYQIMDHEAQRCRGILARESQPAPRKSGKK
jgi:hypothetical protein